MTRKLEQLHAATYPSAPKPVPSARLCAQSMAGHIPSEPINTLDKTYAAYMTWAVSRALDIESRYRWAVELQKAGIEVVVINRVKMVRSLRS